MTGFKSEFTSCCWIWSGGIGVINPCFSSALAPLELLLSVTPGSG